MALYFQTRSESRVTFEQVSGGVTHSGVSLDEAIRLARRGHFEFDDPMQRPHRLRIIVQGHEFAAGLQTPSLFS